MGNAIVAHANEGLAVVAVAKYLKINKDQLVSIRDALALAAQKNGDMMVGRRDFRLALGRAEIRSRPDARVLDLLFTMWDVTGTGKVHYENFIVGISPLACPGESLGVVIQFAMELLDTELTGKIAAYDLLDILKNMNILAAFFGDCVLTLRQIIKLVDSIYDTITLISNDPKDVLTHGECIDRLLQEPLIQKVTFGNLTNGVRCGRRPVFQKPLVRSSTVPARCVPVTKSTFAATTRMEDTSLVSTDVSSIMLSPIGAIPIHKSRSCYSHAPDDLISL